MTEIQGKYTTAVFTVDEIDDGSYKQALQMINHPSAEGQRMVVQPDFHVGAGCLIGTCMTIGDRVVPHYVGVDIGCSVIAYPIDVKVNYPEFDKFVRKNIPHGMSHFQKIDLTNAKRVFRKCEFGDWDDFENDIETTAKRVNCKHAFDSIGTLGGGNHFIEIDEGDGLWLVVHSGSRNFGLQVATYHQDIAIGHHKRTKAEYMTMVNELKKKFSRDQLEMEIQKLKNESQSGKGYLEGVETQNYLKDAKLAQLYAKVNRRTMLYSMLDYLGIKYDPDKEVESMHNYISFDDDIPILRKGAISGNNGELAIIPLNMKDGTLLVKGKGNDEWLKSLPHGAGRLYSRSEAKSKLSMSDFKDAMKDIYTTSVSQATIDESPMAYKPAQQIIDAISGNAEIVSHMVPTYNFKASE
jgi:RNA-splicing ligase RtcB